MSSLPRIVISVDHKRLEQLLDLVGPRPDLDALREELGVTMNSVDWPLPNGRRITAITHQPEAAGDPI